MLAAGCARTCVTAAEYTSDTRDDPIAGLQEVDQAGLHSRAPGRGERHGEPAGHAKEFRQSLLGLVENLEEGRVEVSEERARHRLSHPRGDVRRARAKEESFCFRLLRNHCPRVAARTRAAQKTVPQSTTCTLSRWRSRGR